MSDQTPPPESTHDEAGNFADPDVAPIPPVGELKDPLTQDEQKDMPEVKETLKAIEVETAQEDKTKSDRALDMPIVFEICGEQFQYTSRPMGYLQLIIAEFMGLQSIFTDLRKGLMSELVAEDEAAAENLVNEADVKKFFIDKGEEGLDTMARIAQLLVEPVNKANPGPPDRDSMKLSMVKAKWGLDMQTFSLMLSSFFARDIITVGGSVKNLASLSLTS